MCPTSRQLPTNPEGSKFWVPYVSNKPVEGTEFDTIEMGLKFYKDYARQGGERVKPSSNNVQKKVKNIQSDESQSHVEDKVGREEDYMYLKVAHKLSFPQQQLLYHLFIANLGLTLAWKVFKEMYGGFENIGVTDVECRNYKRGLNNFIGTRDAQMVVEKLLSRQDDTDFKRRLCNIVWTDQIDPEDMFDMRDKWIPAYFRHELMSGLMRTTSRSESENHFLGQLANPDSTLVEFLSRYDTAIDSQRFIYYKNTHNSNYTTPDLKTHLQIEKDVAKLYTNTLFYDVQDEIWSSLMHFCSLSDEIWSSLMHFCSLSVKYTPSDGSVQCSCLREIYATLSKSGCVLDYVLREIYKDVEQSINHLVGDFEKLQLYKDAQTSLKEKAIIDVPNPPKMNTNAAYSATLGREIAMKLSDKPKRLCRTCGEYSYHDSRNCPTKKKGLKDDDVANVEYNEGEDMDFCYSILVISGPRKIISILTVSVLNTMQLQTAP
ncbi:FAR1 DNA binding domain, Zinc finger, SWIM-type, MULE transposase domain, FHY3/FAR1 family [Artemisia annua]|uniref:FAR1 DNA binding domain, Zinc finger, SWIM-type, MULE transposase domain, FHY3/FAR1 family n=1 Tax=Artemisia annua TaxID=35608 RepID=A0A2U1QI50_ARTAN|nr:FAR1 DNA binding domain, Zinc finger, SWIM-type, MULE transposase domain, FHY3/FAR1 family [Artemisia annua]